MPGFANTQEMVDAEVSGFSRYSTWRKTPTQITASGFWFDLSMSSGNPSPQYYAAAPLIATPISHSSDGGIFHGKSVYPKKKFLKRFMIMTSVATAFPLSGTILDYLMYYPFIDESAVDEVQALDNTSTLPRYTDGAGVQMMAVVVAGHSVGTGTFFTVNYTNQDGVAGRTSATVQLNTQFVNGTIITSAPATGQCFGPFIPLQQGDTGVRSVESITVSGLGDVGLFSLVLVKPLAQTQVTRVDGPVENDFFQHFAQLPEIKDDAYLNIICHPGGSLSAVPLHGDATFVWG